MRKALVQYKSEPAGYLMQQDDGSFIFQYTPEWINNPGKPQISLTLPKTSKPYHSSILFPFFFHLLPEGTNRRVVIQNLHIDADDDFGLLINSADVDTIGAVTIVKLEDTI
jgi:HipA-like protein